MWVTYRICFKNYKQGSISNDKLLILNNTSTSDWNEATLNSSLPSPHKKEKPVDLMDSGSKLMSSLQNAPFAAGVTGPQFS